MTNTRGKIYECIERHIRESGCAPTCREISNEIGIGLSTVYGHLIRMQNAGLIRMNADTVRGIELCTPSAFAFGARLMAARESNGLSREGLSRLTGLTVSTVSCHEEGIRRPTADSLRRYNQVLNLRCAV